MTEGVAVEYRTLGRTGEKVSAISLGTEYLIDLPREHVASVIRSAVERGINYFDLFFAQAAFRDNMGAAFEGLRDKVMLAAHLGAIDRDGQYEKTRDLALAEKFFLDFLARYRTERADVLFLHNVDRDADYEEVMRDEGLLGMARRMRREGKARFIGFSGHTVVTSLEAVETGEVDVLMYPVNIAGNAVPGKKDLFRTCAARGVGLVAMKPYAGGKLLQRERNLDLDTWQLGGAAKKVAKPERITPVECISYALSQVGVSTVVPGAKDAGELEGALRYFDAREEERDFAAAVAEFEEYVEGECVYCNHCLPCPSAIDIGRTIRLLEMARGRMTPEIAAAYEAMDAKASDCVQCGACAERCPFGVDAQGKMEEAARIFSKTPE